MESKSQLTRDQKIIERNKEINDSLAIYQIWQIKQKSLRVKSTTI
jgi:hypothetical protein